MLTPSETGKRKIVQEGGWLFLGQAAALLGTLVMIRVLTEHLEPSEYGALALALATAGLVNQVFLGGLSQGIARYYSIAAPDQDYRLYIIATFRLVMQATGAIIFTGTVIILFLKSSDQEHWVSPSILTLIFATLASYNTALNGLQNAARQRVVVAINVSLDIWLRILFALIAMRILGNFITSILIGFIASSLTTTLLQLALLHRATPSPIGSLKSNTNWFKRMWEYSWPFSVWGIFTWMQQASDRWALQIFGETSDVGQYALLYYLGYVPTVLATGFLINLMLPILYQHSGDATNRVRNAIVSDFSWRLVRWVILLSLLGFSITAMLHEEIIYFAASSGYHSKSHLLPWVVLAGGVFSGGQMIALKLMSEMRSRSMLIANIATALLGVAFNFLGASIAGINGVIFGTLSFSVLYFLWMCKIGLFISGSSTKNYDVNAT